ncbi:hypothetical protein F2Q70_00039739 [Brassica cretica]|uniref:Uncharacterized protein n=1 Tax=Brassica cretica TaxID=69181 RepID=A0A8S9MMM4_BRACR|nr:hypothetical protein F2Q70_00039739 [Brassica cretica]KAF2618666.1 hypothetical protein F2Q68_00040429 [Brassica cretica]
MGFGRFRFRRGDIDRGDGLLLVSISPRGFQRRRLGEAVSISPRGYRQRRWSLTVSISPRGYRQRRWGLDGFDFAEGISTEEMGRDGWRWGDTVSRGFTQRTCTEAVSISTDYSYGD